VAQLELQWYQVTVEEFARKFWLQMEKDAANSPVGLHLDHSSDFA